MGMRACRHFFADGEITPVVSCCLLSPSAAILIARYSQRNIPALMGLAVPSLGRGNATYSPLREWTVSAAAITTHRPSRRAAASRRGVDVVSEGVTRWRVDCRGEIFPGSEGSEGVRRSVGPVTTYSLLVLCGIYKWTTWGDRLER